MKKILAFTLIFFSTISSINAEEVKRIFVAFGWMCMRGLKSYKSSLYQKLSKGEHSEKN